MDVPEHSKRSAMINRWAIVSTGAMAYNGTIVAATRTDVVIENGTHQTQIPWTRIRKVTLQKGTEPKPVPMPANTIKASWHWNIDDPEAPLGKSLPSAWKADGQTWRAYGVTVTIFPNGEMPSVDTEGFLLTKKGLRDRRYGVGSMRLSDQDDFRFIQAAFEHLDSDLVRDIHKRIEERDA